MKLYQRTSHLFDGIGGHYRHLIDGNHFMGRNAFEDSWMTKARSNLKKNGEGYQLEVALPGFEKKDIKVTILNDQLEVIAQATDQSDKENQYLIQESSMTTKSRTFQLKPDIDTDAIKVSFQNGMLKIALPYKKEIKQRAESNRRTIEVA